MAMSPVNLPLNVLASALELTGTQKEKIGKIQSDLREQRRALMPPPPMGGPGGPGDPPDGQPGGPPPDREAMRGRFEKMRTLDRAADQKFAAVLTAEQKKRLPGLMQDVRLFSEAGLPIELIGDLNLTADQKKQIAAAVAEVRQSVRQKLDAARQNGDREALRDIFESSRQETYNRALGVMTPEQRETTEKFVAAHPRPERGGPGFGPPPGGFGPPPGGPGFPPPPPDMPPGGDI
jgi:Spy/CpxP family protein refolding chaperone